MNPDILTAVLLTVSTVLGLLLACLRKTPTSEGDWVAEAWWQYPHVRGETLYRARLRSRWAASLASRLHWMYLRVALPSHYPSMADLRPIELPYPGQLQCGVRKVSLPERQRFKPVWTALMPGMVGFTGERAQDHPLQRDAG